MPEDFPGLISPGLFFCALNFSSFFRISLRTIR